MNSDKTVLDKRLLLMLTGLIALAALPHINNLNPWIMGFLLMVVAIRVVLIYQGREHPGRLLVFLLMLVGLANLLIQYPIPVSRTPAVALLISMMGVKLLEIRRQRDIIINVFLGYFTLITLFLYEQAPWLALYALGVMTGLTTVLLEMNRQRPSTQLTDSLKEAGRLSMLSLPVMLILFLFFPRLSGPLWDLGIGDRNGITGLSDKIRPGSISKLIQSRETAFRVYFKGQLPPPSERYWRGPVFWDSDGQEWSLGPSLTPGEVRLTIGERRYAYSVILEATGQKWLFSLDLPEHLPPNTSISRAFLISRKHAINERISYDISSRPDYNTGPIPEDERQRGLELPNNITPRMRQLVRHWRERATDQGQLVNLALDYFRTHPFYYTLIPPLVEENPADQFLFETRRGFCEHYATSFTLLMRIAGIPARVVTGYQGGEYNPLGGYLQVRQSDAHAWSEVWLSGKGWVRVDPTAAVAPERIERSFDFDLAAARIGSPFNFAVASDSLLYRIGSRLRWGLDALNTGWKRWVLGYTLERQRDLLKNLGLGFLHGRNLVVGMILFVSTALGLVLFALWRHGHPQQKDRVQRLYLQFCNKLSRQGLTRAPHENASDFAQRVIAKRHELKGEVEQITRLYLALRYGRKKTQEGIRMLGRHVRCFQP